MILLTGLYTNSTLSTSTNGDKYFGGGKIVVTTDSSDRTFLTRFNDSSSIIHGGDWV